METDNIENVYTKVNFKNKERNKRQKNKTFLLFYRDCPQTLLTHDLLQSLDHSPVERVFWALRSLSLHEPP